MSALWCESQPLVLASGSATRRLLLQAAALPLEIIKPDVDEGALAKALIAQKVDPAGIALALAKAKGEAVSALHPARLILAADQTLDFQGRLGMKAPTLSDARRQLLALRNKSHQLHSAAVLIKAGRVLWSGIETATLTMRDFSDAFLDTYLDMMGDRVLGTVGAYELEGLGIHLFSEVSGSQPAVLGLPLSGLLEALRATGALKS